MKESFGSLFCRNGRRKAWFEAKTASVMPDGRCWLRYDKNNWNRKPLKRNNRRIIRGARTSLRLKSGRAGSFLPWRHMYYPECLLNIYWQEFFRGERGVAIWFLYIFYVTKLQFWDVKCSIIKENPKFPLYLYFQKKSYSHQLNNWNE